MATPDFSKHFYTLEALKKLPPLKWTIKDILPMQSMAVLYGEPGIGKSFVGLAMAMAIAGGHSFIGKDAVHGGVLYVAAEGLFGMRNRVIAHELCYPRTRFNIDFLNALELPGCEQDLVSFLKQKGIKPALIVIDTFARVSAGIDENAAAQMGSFVRALDVIKVDLECSLLVIHHTGKNSDKERGSSALRGAADVMILCKKSDVDDHVLLKCDKMKDAEYFPEILVHLRKQILSDGSSSQVLDPALHILDRTFSDNPGSNTTKHINDIVAILGVHSEGLKHSDLKELCGEAGLKGSTFDRALRTALSRKAVQKFTTGKSALYKAGVNVTSVSDGVIDTNG